MEDKSLLAKEIITVLGNFNNEFIEKIPNEFLESFINISKKCDKKIELDMSKELKDQDISQECKDFISIMYYYYFADEKEKKELIKKWKENDS